MIEILSPMGKYKYDTWRILLVKCYIDNSVRLQSCIWNINKHYWCRCRGGSRYLLSIYRLHRIILTSIISLTDLFATLWLFVVVTGKCFMGPKSPIVHHSFLRFTSRFILIGLIEFLIRQVSKKSNQMDPRMSFKQLVDETHRGMGVLSWFPDISLNHRHGRLGIQLGILLWVVTRS
jgi:hypothetical protein